MNVGKKFLGLIAAGIMASFGAADAATLSISGGSASTLGANYNPTTATGLSAGSAVTKFTVATSGDSLGGGLVLTGQSRVTFTFLGKEAGAKDFIFETVGGLFLRNTVAAGTSIVFDQLTTNAYVKFFFTTNLFLPATPKIVNGGVDDDKRLALAFSDVFNGGMSVLALFDDGAGKPDRDFDDMVVQIDVQAIPLPAGGLLLLTGLGGLALARRRKAL